MFQSPKIVSAKMVVTGVSKITDLAEQALQVLPVPKPQETVEQLLKMQFSRVECAFKLLILRLSREV